MVAHRHTSTKMCVLPSFQDLCQSLKSSEQEDFSRSPSCDGSIYSDYLDARPLPPTPTNSLIPNTSGYVCPISECNLRPRRFTVWDQWLDHMYDNHPHLVPEFPHDVCTNQRVAVTSSAPVTAAAMSPVLMGWFDPSAERAVTTIESVKGLDRDELLQTFFEVDSMRPLYGDIPTSKKTSPLKQNVTVGHRGVGNKVVQSKTNHMESERDRRVLHFDFQSELHLRTPELAHQLAEKDLKMQEIKKSTSSKGPGKNDQFVSDIYMHHLSAIVVQSEHNGRIAAERRVEQLEQQLDELRQSGFITSRRRSYKDEYEHEHAGDRSASTPKRRRTVDIGQGSPGLQRGGRNHPPTPSPSLSATSSKSRVWRLEL